MSTHDGTSDPAGIPDREPGACRVLIVDDSGILRLGLKDAIENTRDFIIAGEAQNSNQALELFRELKPDVVTMDYRLPDGTGLDCLRKIRKLDPDACVLMLSVHEEEEIVWQSFQAGASGYLTKTGESDDFMAAIRTIAAGGRSFPDQILEKIRARSNRAELTGRERDVLELISSGKSNKEISSILNVSEQTVKMHVSNLLKKLGVMDRTQAVIQAARRGLIDLG